MISFFLSVIRPVGLVLILAAAAVTDLVSKRIPNRLIRIGLYLWLICQILAFPGWIRLLQRAAGAVLMAAVLFLLAVLADRLFHKRGLGSGDIKLLFIVTLFLGVMNTLNALFAALLAALVLIVAGLFKKSIWGWFKGSFPFAPFIAFGTILVIIFKGL